MRGGRGCLQQRSNHLLIRLDLLLPHAAVPRVSQEGCRRHEWFERSRHMLSCCGWRLARKRRHPSYFGCQLAWTKMVYGEIGSDGGRRK
eukprot:8488231-Pyramimonas_sp.AAC.1